MRKPEPSVDLGYPTEAHGRIPAFADVVEEAEFRDTRDFPTSTTRRTRSK